MQTNEVVDKHVKPVIKLAWELNGDSDIHSTFKWRGHEIRVGIRSFSGPDPEGQQVIFDFHYKEKEYHFGLTDIQSGKSTGHFPSMIKSGKYWLNIIPAPDSLEIVERSMQTLGDYLERLELIFRSYGFRIMKDKEPGTDPARSTFTVRMVPRTRSATK